MQDDSNPLPVMLLPDNNAPASSIPFYYYLCPMQSTELSSSPPFAMQFVPQPQPQSDSSAADELLDLEAKKLKGQNEGEVLVPGGQMKKRTRSATRDQLVQVENEYIEGYNLAYIRVWNNDKKHKFYDCSCGRRRPIHDRKKIINHIAKMHGTHTQ